MTALAGSLREDVSKKTSPGPDREIFILASSPV